MPPLNTFDKTIIALALANSIAVPASQAATITVAGAGAGAGACSLQDAIRTANSDMNVGSCMLTGTVGGADIIDIPTQTIMLSSVDIDGNPDSLPVDLGPSGLPLVNSVITIQGNGSTIQRDAAAEDFRIISLYNNEGTINGGSASLTLDSITLTGGVADELGGAIFVGYAFDVGSSILTLNNATITGNYSGSDGGGIYAGPGTVIEINNSKLIANSAHYSGGGVYANQVDSLTINYSTIDDNTADLSGGGVWLDSAENFTIKNTTLSNNDVLDSGGAVAAYGINNIQIVNSTISGNIAPMSGSGLFLYASTMVMTNSTVANNSGNSSTYFVGIDNADFANSATFINSVIANSQGVGCAEGDYSVLTTTDSNWFQDTSCDVVGGIADGDPGLGTLTDNGGLTETHAPQTGSGLINAGDFATCMASPVDGIDQRGLAFTRGAMSFCYIGAVEGIVDEPVVEDDASFFIIPLQNGKTVIFSL